jgi:type II secretory pathway component GspD/PulD (secretin)
LTAEDLGVLLEALETVGQKSDVVSERIMTALNNETKIVLKKKSSDRRNQNDDFEFQLKLMTEIDDEKNLKIQLLPDMFWSIEDGAETKTRVLQLDTGAAQPEVKLSSLETVVLGGLTVEEEVQTTSKVPLLGDIPILGFPFRQQNSLMQKTEYVIFLTPKIRLGDAPLVGPTTHSTD